MAGKQPPTEDLPEVPAADPQAPAAEADVEPQGPAGESAPASPVAEQSGTAEADVEPQGPAGESAPASPVAEQSGTAEDQLAGEVEEEQDRDPTMDQTLPELKSAPMQRRVRRPPPPSSQEPSLRQLSQSMGSLHNDGPAPHMHTLSSFKTAPAVTMGGRVASGSFFTNNSNPGPGSYNMSKASNHSKYRGVPQFSFGGGSRFGMGENPNKERPGPGHYGVPRDPAIERGPRTCFSGAPRAGLADVRDAPGPGAYELKSCLSEGKMFTVAGRHYGSSMKARMQPGPGAYDPRDSFHGKYNSSPKVGFGTSTREDFAMKREAGKPGPGTYDTASKKAVGTDAAKFSIRARQKRHDLTSYLEPGPGHYASHASSFMQRTF